LTLEVLVIAFIRIAGSLPVLRWPFVGALIAILVDLSDLLLQDILDLGGLPDYQALDKGIDQVYLAAFLAVAWRWAGPARTVAIVLYAFRLVGFVAFELTHERALLLLFPNVFEFWFLLVAAIGAPRVAGWSRRHIVAVLAVLTALKEFQEWALHGARLFDSIGAVEFLQLVWARLTGG